MKEVDQPKRLTAQIEATYEDDKAAREDMSKIRKFDFPEFFVEQSINLDADDREETAMSFSDRSNDMLYVALGEEEGLLEATLTTQFSRKEEFMDILRQISSAIPEGELSEFNIRLERNEELEEVDFPVENNSDFKLNGIRLERDGKDFGIHKRKDGNIGIMGSFSDLGPLKNIDTDSFLDERLSETESFLEEIS